LDPYVSRNVEETYGKSDLDFGKILSGECDINVKCKSNYSVHNDWDTMRALYRWEKSQKAG